MMAMTLSFCTFGFIFSERSSTPEKPESARSGTTAIRAINLLISPFDNLSPSKWLPRYYDTVSILNQYLGKSLEDFVGLDAATAAAELIKSLDQQVMKNVKTKSAAHAKVWEEKSPQEQAALVQAALGSTLHMGWGEVTRECPVCGSNGTLSGNQVKEFPEKYEDEELLMDVQFGDRFKWSCGHLKGAEEVWAIHGFDNDTKPARQSLYELYEPEYPPRT